MSKRKPLLRPHREGNYKAQTGKSEPTPAQRRRARRKEGKLMRKRGESA